MCIRDRVIDTYWSDHCRHTTFSTCLEAIDFERGPVTEAVEKAFESYDATRDALYGEDTDRPMTLMDMAVIGTKEIKKRGLIPDLDESEEINACSVNMTVDPVSYTHLDVYKRQAVCLASETGFCLF